MYIFTGDWAEFALEHAVTSLTVFHKSLVGVQADGSLVIGNKKGGFVTAAFPDMFIYKLETYKGNTFACSNKGLFKIIQLQERLVLHSMGIQCAVTDIVFTANEMLIATLQNGILQRDAVYP